MASVKDKIFFRYRKIDDKYLITNDLGDYTFLSAEELERIMPGGRMTNALKEKLKSGGFMLDPATISQHTARFKNKNQFFFYGPNLHIVVTTLRCNTTCIYCHSSRALDTAEGVDMSLETARKVVDLIFESTSPQITIEFQGGEPTLNLDCMKYIMEYARDKNKTRQKSLDFSVVSNLSTLNDEVLEVIVAPDVNICCSLDGIEEVHNRNRKLKNENAFQKTVDGIRRINQIYRDNDYDPYFYRVQALLTTTRDILPYYKELVDQYVDLDMFVIHLRPLDPFGFARNTAEKIGYSVDEFVDFYSRCVDYMIELNKQGTEILEKFASMTMQKVFSSIDPNFLDIRSPCGAGIGQIAYNYDGRIFTCDEGRMVYEMGEDLFQMGTVDNSLQELVESDACKSCCIASCQESQAECSICAYKPYCGVCPVFNYFEQGHIFGQMKTNSHCRLMMGLFDYLFGKLLNGDEATVNVLKKWTINRPKPF